MNSFPQADEAALENVHSPLYMEVNLAPEDPRRADLEHKAIAKLRRVLPKVHVSYQSATSIGLFEQTSPHYGEIWYEIEGRTADEPRDDGGVGAGKYLRARRGGAAG